MNTLFPIYKSPEILQFQKIDSQGNWKWDIYYKEDPDNIIPACFSKSHPYIDDLPQIISFTIRKLKESELDKRNLVSEGQFIMGTDVFAVEETKAGYYRIFLGADYQSTEIDLIQGIFQCQFIMDNDDLLYSDLICLKGVPVPAFSCSEADFTDGIFTIKVTRTDVEAEAENTGILTVELYEGTELEVYESQEFTLGIGNNIVLTYDFSKHPVGASLLIWKGACSGSWTTVTFDNTAITWDSDVLTFDQTKQ